MTALTSLHRPLGRTGLRIPPVIFGTSCLGNLYQVVPDETKRALVSEMVRCCPAPVVLDSAGKYGAGLALQVIGDCLRKLKVPPANVILSNKLGWYQRPLSRPEPSFEPGVWVGINHDAESRISYETKYFVMKELDIMGSRNATLKNCADVIQVLESGRYPVTETITHCVDFSRADAALAEWAADPSRVTKIQVELQGRES